MTTYRRFFSAEHTSDWIGPVYIDTKGCMVGIREHNRWYGIYRYWPKEKLSFELIGDVCSNPAKLAQDLKWRARRYMWKSFYHKMTPTELVDCLIGKDADEKPDQSNT